MTRGIVVSVFALVLAACRSPSMSEGAAEFVVRDMLELIPAEVQSVEQRRISGHWQTIGRGRVPERVIAASGLAVVDTTWRPADSLVLVLNLFEPRMLNGDSVEVVGEWLVYEPGQPFWAPQYEYHLRCRSSCELLDRYGPGYLHQSLVASRGRRIYIVITSARRLS
jgi:hypothetical protein